MKSLIHQKVLEKDSRTLKQYSYALLQVTYYTKYITPQQDLVECRKNYDWETSRY